MCLFFWRKKKKQKTNNQVENQVEAKNNVDSVEKVSVSNGEKSSAAAKKKSVAAKKSTNTTAKKSTKTTKSVAESKSAPKTEKAAADSKVKTSVKKAESSDKKQPVKKDSATKTKPAVKEDNASEVETFEEKIITEEGQKDIKIEVSSLSNRYLEKLNKLDKTAQKYYTEIKNEMLSFDGWTNSITKDGDTFLYNYKTQAKITVLQGQLRFFVDMEKEELDGRYKRFDESEYKKYQGIPLEFTVDKDVEVRKVKNTINRLAAILGLEKKEKYTKKSFKKLTLQ